MLSMNITSVSDQQNTLFYFIISSNTIITDDEFINEQNLNIENASNLIFSGEVKGTANINSKS